MLRALAARPLSLTELEGLHGVLFGAGARQPPPCGDTISQIAT